MPEIVTEFPATANNSRSRWEQYCDGRIWKFTAKECKSLGVACLKNLRGILYQRARAVKHRHARIHEVGDALYIQVFEVKPGEEVKAGRPRVVAEAG
jgi:hypothetical protein